MEYSYIGKRIREKRKALHFTQEKLAELADITATHVSHIETGNTKLSLPVLVKIANALNSSADELLCDNLVHSKRIFVSEIAELLEQCDDTQVRMITELVKATKTSLDKYYSPHVKE